MKKFFLPTQATTSGPSNFSPEIESLRGLVALNVCFGHFYLVVCSLAPPHLNLLTRIIGGVFNPQAAVLLFFTISGVALGRLLRKEPIVDSASFLGYLCRRGFRLSL